MNPPFKVFCLRRVSILLLALAGCAAMAVPCLGADKPAPKVPEKDVLVLSNGDTLHGLLLKAVGGKVTFRTNALGDLDVSWDDVKELHTQGGFGVLAKGIKGQNRKSAAQTPIGPLDMTDGSITIRAANAPGQATPVKDTAFVVDATTMDKQIHHEPNFFTGWNGAATAGATLVQATQNQYTVSGGLSLVRAVPMVTWLAPRNRTSTDFTGSYGKITEPGVATTKSAIFHVDAERDEYFTPSVYALAQIAFDHNFAQNLQLQQIYGGGLGWTLFSTPRHEADVKGTVQYEKQKFITGTTGTNENLIGSTFAANYLLHTKPFTFSQAVEYIPAYNVARAYSLNETNTLAISAYKSFGFSIGTLDSYLNNPPATIPVTKRNSFQFTMGLTYAIKSKY